MLIEFSVANFRSFKDKQTLSFLPSVRSREVSTLKSKKYSNLAVLPTIAIYGPNNSGKSNLIKGIKALKWLVIKSGNFNSDKQLAANEFFAFNSNNFEKPTVFEIDFLAENDNRYKFLVEFNRIEIIREELSFYNVGLKGKVSLKKIYKRKGLEIDFGDLKGRKDSINFEKNQLFLSRADIDGNKELKVIYSFFSGSLCAYSFTENEYTNFLTRAYKDYINDEDNELSKMPQLIETIVKEMDTGILGIETSMVDVSEISFPDNMSQSLKNKIFNSIKDEFRIRHRLFDGENESGTTTLSLNEQSIGTRKMIGLLPLIVSTLSEGDVLVMDEMNTSLHTKLTFWIISLFNNSKTNPKNAQLIITTHDISLINRYLYDRDQIYVMEKNKYQSSNLYSFADISNISKVKNLDDYYETGRLGGVPYIAAAYLEDKISNFVKEKNEE